MFLDGEEITGSPGEGQLYASEGFASALPPPLRTMWRLPLIIRGEKKKAARSQVQPYFQEFGLEGTQKKYPAQLSGGMRQRAALLRTYMFSQKIALLDEPFSALDTLTKSAMHKWYLNVMEQIHLSTIFITHDIRRGHSSGGPDLSFNRGVREPSQKKL